MFTRMKDDLIETYKIVMVLRIPVSAASETKRHILKILAQVFKVEIYRYLDIKGIKEYGLVQEGGIEFKDKV